MFVHEACQWNSFCGAPSTNDETKLNGSLVSKTNGMESSMLNQEETGANDTQFAKCGSLTSMFWGSHAKSFFLMKPGVLQTAHMCTIQKSTTSLQWILPMELLYLQLVQGCSNDKIPSIEITPVSKPPNNQSFLMLRPKKDVQREIEIDAYFTGNAKPVINDAKSKT